MMLPDVNILVQAFRGDSPEHERCRRWLTALVNGSAPKGLSPQVIGGTIRIATHPKIFSIPSPLDEVLHFCDVVLEPSQCVVIQPGGCHWEIFKGLCRVTDARGNLVSDAWLAALAIESGCEWVTLDRDYARFPNLKWHLPA